ncbi:MAG TPA: formate dehydrogenase subunit gamma [Candidatus Dormibacteraeota bacterium]|nr:formate dehydrogenase subunit gamma [Candidatus Dormibacteraeota bacterium]
MRKDRDSVVRYSAGDRFVHWTVALAFVLLALSGLALFQPGYFYLSELFGGGTWSRILHPFIGIVLVLFFAQMAVRMWRWNRLTPNDGKWLAGIRDVVVNREDRVPAPGRYNAGQKLLFWTMVTTIALLLLSGFVIWRPWFAPYFSPELWRVAVVVHAVAAFVIIAGIIVHIYASIWTVGSIPAMVRGTVSRGWARQHHGAWYDEISKKEPGA